MLYDPVAEQVVVHWPNSNGSDGGPTNVLGSWSWDGRRWTPLGATQSAPITRQTHAAVYDVSSGKHLIYGGYNLSNAGQRNPSSNCYISAEGLPLTLLNETWTFDKQSWKKADEECLTPTVGRVAPHLFFDTTRQNVVLLGGILGGTSLAEMWEWDGASWRRIAQGQRLPNLHSGYAGAYDATHELMALYGGVVRNADGESVTTEESKVRSRATWLWDGAEWMKLQTITSAPPKWKIPPAMAYDSTREEFIVFGGMEADGGNSDPRYQTWRLRIERRTNESHGGCACGD